ncbi:mechanosensitive ion channel family protein [Acinetobacter pollinis]|uniref:mechanosensitive ion channel family protein n=1 Tax=Acinetobacter pollinis TaxID=2605270 RepID=UPI001D18C5A5|nr:mechanosensitive ion channel domain-containing protein [Acinetobacter pollinis]
MKDISKSLVELFDWTDKFPWLEMLLGMSALFLAAYIANFIAKKVVVQGIQKILMRLPSARNSALAHHNVIRRLANIVPALIIMNGIDSVPHLSEKIIHLFQMIAQTSIFLSIALTFSEVLNVFNTMYQKSPNAKNKPIKGYLQLVKLMIFVVCALMILGTFLKKDVFNLLAGFGAMATILMLVFQNTILSLVASVQIASYDMIRIGDWIEMPSLNADGDVIDMSLHTVTVQNFDKTITTIPTNKLVTDTFRNWRGVASAGVRRIKRSIYIDQNSIGFMSDDELNKLKDFLLLNNYLNKKETEITEFNHTLMSQAKYNQRRLTNLGTFRAYVDFYLKQKDGIAKEELILVRQMQPTSVGLPLEIYAFTNTTIWIEYEAIQSDIFDHLISILPEFNLKIYQAPTAL